MGNCGNCRYWTWCHIKDKNLNQSQNHCSFSPSRFTEKREEPSELEISKNLISLDGLLGIIKRVETHI